MDESAPMRAVMIGASIFITIMTITAVINYYATAKEMVASIGTGVDYTQEYSEYIQNILLKASTETNHTETNIITGADVKNLLHYFYHNERVEIRIGNAKALYIDDSTTGSSSLIKTNNSGAVNNNDTEYNEFQKKLVVAQEFTITKSESDGKLSLILNGK